MFLDLRVGCPLFLGFKPRRGSRRDGEAGDFCPLHHSLAFRLAIRAKKIEKSFLGPKRICRGQ
jgi:hypothetical protein